MKSKNIEYQEKIDHLRFLAAALIVMFHSVVTHFIWKPLGTDQINVSPLLNVLVEGHTAVGLFMTLSGFLFTIICKDKEIDILGFYRNRFLRIYPLFTVFLLMACYLDQKRNGLVNLLASLCFLQNTNIAVYHVWLTEVLWTIAVEFQFYLLFPFLLAFFRKYGYKYLLGIIAASSLLRLSVFMCFGTVKILSYLTIFGRIDQFVIGMILGFSFARLRHHLTNPIYILLSFIPLMLAASYFHTFGGLDASHRSYVWIFWPTLEAAVWGFLIVAYNASNFRLPPRVSRWLALAGSLSFSMYVVHYCILRTTGWFIMPIMMQKPDWLVPILHQFKIHPFTAALFFGSCIVFPITFLLSMMTYFVIEKPFLELRSSYTKSRKRDDDAVQIETPKSRIAVPV